MRKIVMLAVVVAAVPAPAQAKGVKSARVCGPAGCTETIEGSRAQRLAFGGPVSGAPKRAEPFWRIELVPFHQSEQKPYTLLYLPRANLMRMESGTWMQARSDPGTVVRGLVRGRMAPFPPRELFPRRARAPEPVDDGSPVVAVVLGSLSGLAAALIALSRARARRPSAT